MTTSALSASSSPSSFVASKSFSLHDPSLLGLEDDEGEWLTTTPTSTFDVIDPGGSSQEREDGTSVIARVRKMGREDTKAVSFVVFSGGSGGGSGRRWWYPRGSLLIHPNLGE